VLNLESLELDKFTEAHLRFLQNLAGHAAIALERARLFASNQRQIVLLDAIRQLSLDLLDSPDMDTVLGHVCATALSITRGVNVHIYFYNRATHTLEFAASLWTDGRRNVQIAIPRPNGLTMQGLDSDRPIISDDFERIPGVPTERLGIFPIRHYGQTVGALNVAVTDPTSMDEATIRALELLTNQAASAIERVRLSENRQNQIQLLEALRRSSVEMMGAMNPGQLMELVCRSALLMARAEDVHLYAYNKATDQVTFGASLRQDGRRNIEVSPPRQDGITYRTARSGEIQQIFAGDIPVNRDEPYVEMIAGIPLKHGDQVVGVLNVAVTNATDLNEDGIRALQLLASQSAAALLTARLYEEVRAGRDQMQVILNTARDGMALIGRAGQLLHMNPAAEQLLDVNLRPYLGKSLLQSVWETRRKYAPEDFRHANNLKAVWRILRDDPYQITHRQIHLEVRGQIKYLEEESAPVLAENGDPIGRLFVWHDVTEAQQLEKARNELTNTIIHDLRSPLTAIKGGLNMLPDIIGDPDELEIAHEILHIAENSTDGLLNLVESLLDVARLESGEMPLEITMTPLAEPVAEATQLLEILARDSQVALIADLPPDLPPLSIDADKVRRVLINLIDNALHYTPPGGRVLVKAAISDADPNTALITVEDSGPGIPPDIRDHVFTPFATGITGNPERKHRGLGLGLTFCKLAVEAHGGRIWIEDGLDGGAAFCFTLPISQ
jgi:NtrC-family two-component system sensor histidine kinase KinB